MPTLVTGVSGEVDGSGEEEQETVVAADWTVAVDGEVVGYGSVAGVAAGVAVALSIDLNALL